MSIKNRRLREVNKQIEAFKVLIETSDNIGESLIYQGKLEALEREKADIEKRYEVKV